ncbi:MAG: translation initiation factor IF-2 [Candidatus Omnitrophica bacterium]|nr:translation initiation factor IF-2 [Candidatus Omnitrophota bacterium]MCM8807050.1 translation initiation factor IF-2 [Candidatus Omnitrophota bacterium]
MRIYELSKQYNKPIKEILEILEKIGIKGKKSLSSLKDEELKKVEEVFKKEELKKVEEKPVEEKKKIIFKGNETVKEIAEKIQIPPNEILKYLLNLKIVVNVNQKLEKSVIEKICEKFNILPVFEEEKIILPEKKKEEPEPIFVKRAPVVTIMGHVDHGKTTILDKIRKSRIAEKEVGQITQKIGAYKVNLPEGSIVFLDTPGHEAFTAMRAMGAKVTDIVVLVVAADEGVKPQTIEALNHAKSANVPIIVAINKIDKPNINPEIIKQQLSEHGLIPEEWGGDTVYVKVSGLTGEGINELLEMILLVGEMLELKAQINCKGEGTVIESSLDRFRGPVISVIVEKGKLKVGDPFIAGTTWGKIRAMFDDWGNRLEEADPSTPVEILGAHDIVVPGSKFKVVDSDKEAKEFAERIEEERKKTVIPVKRLSLKDLYEEIKKGEVKELNIILKTDFYNSIDAIKNVISKIPQNEIKINILHAGTGPISESDVLLASASNGIILGFKVPVDPKAKEIAKKENVEIRTYEIIYDIGDELVKAIEGMLEPEIKEELQGQALVKKVFKLSKNLVVAGCLVVDGKVIKNSKVKIVRNGKIIFEGVLSSLKRFKESVNEVSYNNECGIGIDNFYDFQEGDIIQCYALVEVPRKLKGV